MNSKEFLVSRLESLLHRSFESGVQKIQISGSSSVSTLSLLLSNISSKKINSLPHLVVVPGVADANRLTQGLSFFDSQRCVEILPHFDVSPYQGLYPKPQALAERIRFLWKAQNAKPGDIFIAPVGSLLQKTIPFLSLSKNTFTLSVGDELPANFTELLLSLGYQSGPLVEDVGHFSQRGGILDIFSAAHQSPVRIELFGDSIESLRFFSPIDQGSTDQASSFTLLPAREIIWSESTLEDVLEKFRLSVVDRSVDRSEFEEALRSLSRQSSIDGIDFLLPFFHNKLDSVVDHFSSDLNVWILDSIEVSRHSDQIQQELLEDFKTSSRHLIRPEVSSLYLTYDQIQYSSGSIKIELSNLVLENFEDSSSALQKIPYSTQSVMDISNLLQTQTPGSEFWLTTLQTKFSFWKKEGYRIFLGVKSKSQAERIRLFLEKMGWTASICGPGEFRWSHWVDEQERNFSTIHIIQRPFPEGLRLPEEKFIFLRDEDLLGKKLRTSDSKSSDEFQKKARRLSFGDLKPGDHVVHVQHGIGVYEGLKIMSIGSVESEFIEIQYKDKDRLYLPVYRVGQLQKYSGSGHVQNLDKLGGVAWEKTKSKVKNHLRDIASELLQLYAKRAELHREAFQVSEDLDKFSLDFPFDETDDQLKAIEDLTRDMTNTKPMDRLICGDVGFGKTEVAMRAAFLSAINKKQVAILAPTTVLSFQHFETFKKRFSKWPLEIRELNRFVSNADIKKTIKELKEGRVDIIIGTHRLLSKDVQFKNLGLLVIDEEQKFGVAHKERIRKLRSEVDTLAMSATPIPRTLNMSLMGVRDLSLINTAPMDRLPTRTFVSKWDDETIRKSILNEIKRGGQVYFIHNRIQSIYNLADEIKKIVPEARIKIGHGQMEEEELEKTMIQFFHHEIDVLVCTTIVESGMDIPKANTMFIDQAHMMGLSQLYQLRGRVGRSKQRAYCYLLIPKNKQIDKIAQERLKVIQENTALGSGIRIAQYDLELRGAGNLLGEEQSGHINSVGYELYMELLDEAIHQLKGDPLDEIIEPEINLRIPALIPESYISDIRLRLSYYKALADIESSEDLEKIENEFKDQFGEIPEATLNLMGLMLIRSSCKSLGVKDISAGLKNISLVFSEKTKMKPEAIIALAMRENKKYSITPDNRLNIRMNNITWPAVYEEINYLLKL